MKSSVKNFIIFEFQNFYSFLQLFLHKNMDKMRHNGTIKFRLPGVNFLKTKNFIHVISYCNIFLIFSSVISAYEYGFK